MSYIRISVFSVSWIHWQRCNLGLFKRLINSLRFVYSYILAVLGLYCYYWFSLAVVVAYSLFMVLQDSVTAAASLVASTGALSMGFSSCSM